MSIVFEGAAEAGRQVSPAEKVASGEMVLLPVTGCIFTAGDIPYGAERSAGHAVRRPVRGGRYAVAKGQNRRTTGTKFPLLFRAESCMMKTEASRRCGGMHGLSKKAVKYKRLSETKTVKNRNNGGTAS